MAQVLALVTPVGVANLKEAEAHVGITHILIDSLGVEFALKISQAHPYDRTGGVWLRGRLELVVPRQRTEGKRVRGQGTERGLLTVFKAIALIITQASFLKPLSHHTAPQDSSTTWNHQVAEKGENHRRFHLLQTRDSSGRKQLGERVESQIISTKIPGTLGPLKEEKRTVGVRGAIQCVEKNGSPARLNQDTSSHPFSDSSYCKPRIPEARLASPS